ncbi:unnamed protein product [Paramecium primaurelia]|uniref:Uncharacterized protein n=1 Tax=Paramecium primaurelia TaxID=5886 RepID=A0A8S1KCG4_PARPR|nr:unnamed protein product [Paramecium primaurelia]
MQNLLQKISKDQELKQKKIPVGELQNILHQYNITNIELDDEQEFTYQELYNYLNLIQYKDSLQHISKDQILTRTQNEWNIYTIQRDQNEKDFHDLVQERLAKGFQFDVNDCYFVNPDIFQYIQLCLDEIKQQQQQQQINNTQIQKPRPGGIRSQQDLQIQSQNQTIKPKDNSILEGIYIEPENEAKQIEYFFYKYFINDQISKLITRCGWKSGNEHTNFNVENICKQCISRAEYTRAAAIACVHFQFSKAIDILRELLLNKDKETYQILMALQGIDEMKNLYTIISQKEVLKKIIEICQVFLENKKFNDPYYELIAEFLKKDKFLEYLNYGAHKISIFDRIGLWGRFCQGRKPQIQNLLDNIILNGKSEISIQYLQKYLDDKGDLQLCGIISIYLYILDYPQKDKLIKNFNSYIDYLLKQDIPINSLLCRIKQTELEYNKPFLNEAFKQYLSPQISMCCNFCSNPVGQPYLEIQRRGNPRRGNLARDDNPRTNLCASCNHALSNCVVCAQYFTIPNNQDIDRKRGSNQQRILDQLKIEQAIVWCLSCKHGGHQSHIEEWFELYQKCPVYDCDCECSII